MDATEFAKLKRCLNDLEKKCGNFEDKQLELSLTCNREFDRQLNISGECLHELDFN